MSGSCRIEGCGRHSTKRGLCGRHYKTWWTLNPGATDQGSARSPAIRAFLLELVSDPPDECVLWPFGRLTKGYAGHIADWRAPSQLNGGRWGRPQIAAYRLARELFTGQVIPEGMHARHLCGNGALGCVNPRCITPGTPQQNSDDTRAMGRHVGVRGESHYLAKLTEAQITEIRSLYPELSQRAIAEQFGLAQQTVGCIVRRETWSHVA